MRAARILIVALAVLAISPAFAQPDRPDGPRRGRRPDQPRQIDPATDEVLQTIKAAVSPSQEQWDRIVDAYKAFRDEQRQAMRAARQAMRGQREGDGPDRQRRREAREAGPDEQRRREARETAWQKVGETLEPINEKFLADCRALMTAGQLEAWDGCAAGLDLMPRRRGRRGDAGGAGGAGAGGPKEGDAAPGFELKDLDGGTVSLQALRGKPVVLEFGSYTCPVFRRQADGLETLRGEFGDRVHWVLIYTREAHPTDGWVVPANTREGIEIPQHVSYDTRLESATLCREKMGLEMTVLIDGFDDKVTEKYRGHPNRGYVIDAEGTVVSRQVWIDPQRTREALARLMEEGTEARRHEGTE